VNRPFFLGLASAVLGVIGGTGYRMAIKASGHCAALFGVQNPSVPCSNSESWVAFLNVFALVTLLGCLVSGILLARHVRETADGYVGLGDGLMAIGTLVSLVEIVILAVFGSYLGVAYGVLVVSLTLFALKQERQVSLAVSALMALFCGTWLVSDSSAVLLASSPCLLWTFAAAGYVASLVSGEEISQPV
jgi:hypothetical protein